MVIKNIRFIVAVVVSFAEATVQKNTEKEALLVVSCY